MIIWYKLRKNNRTVSDTVIECNEDISRTAKVFKSLEQVCHKWDLAVPIWLEPTIRDFQSRSKARFYPDNFPESVDFDYMEIEVIEE